MSHISHTITALEIFAKGGLSIVIEHDDETNSGGTAARSFGTATGLIPTHYTLVSSSAATTTAPNVPLFRLIR